MIRRMIGAAMLNPHIYEEVEADRSATLQAMAVVVLVALATGIGNIGPGSIFGLLVLQLQKCGEEFQAASVMAAPGRCLVPPSPPGPPQH